MVFSRPVHILVQLTCESRHRQIEPPRRQDEGHLVGEAKAADWLSLPAAPFAGMPVTLVRVHWPADRPHNLRAKNYMVCATVAIHLIALEISHIVEDEAYPKPY